MNATRRRPSARRPARAGLTLVEVLLAVVLLGTGTTILLVSVQRGLAVARRSVQLETARRLAAVLDLSEPIDWSQDPPPTLTEGTFEPPFSDYRWQREIRPFGDPDLPLFEVSTRIAWGDRARPSEETFVTLRFVEDESGGGFARPAPAEGEAGGGRGAPPASGPRAAGGRP